MKKTVLIFLLAASFAGRAQTTFSYTPSTSPSIPMFTSGVSLDSLKKLMAGQLSAAGSPQFTVNNNGILKPGATDYQVYGASGAITEFHDHEVRTANGAVLPLETTYISANYFANRPAASGNGTEIVDKGVYTALSIGSGTKAWLVEDAPERSRGALVELATSANLQYQNWSGAFSIKVPGGSSFQMATSSQGGFIGWKNADVTTSLMISADQVNIDGQLNVDRQISAGSGLDITDGHLAFGQDGELGFIALQDNKQTGVGNTLTLQSFTTSGIYVNAAGVSEDNLFSGIRFALNDRTMMQFYTNGVVLGGGFPEGSAILTINSMNGGVVPPKYYDYQLRNIQNVAEGTYVYSLDHHALAWYNGQNWICCIGQEIIQ